MKRYVHIFIVAVTFIIIVGLCGCDEQVDTETSRFMGSWENQLTGDLYTFSADGSMVVGYFTGEYILENQTITMTYGPFDAQSIYTYNYTFSEDDTKLTLTEVDTSVDLVLMKQE